MKRPARIAVILLSGGVLLAAAGGIGWSMHRFLGGNAVSTPPLADSEAEASILRELAALKASKQAYLAVPEADGRVLRMLAESIGAKHVVEIGTSTGYSGLWLCLGMRQTGGRLTTFEIDPDRAAKARDLFHRAGVGERATVILGDAHRGIRDLKEPIDLLFLDADKDGYIDYLRTLLPLVRPGGLIVAHNMSDTSGYVEYLRTDPALDTVLLTQGSGLALTLRKRRS